MPILTFKHPDSADLFRYAEGLVDGHERMAPGIRKHLVRCAVCRGELNAMVASMQVAQRAESLAPTDACTHELLLRARAERRPASPFGSMRTWSAAAAVLVVSIFGANQLLSPDAASGFETQVAPISLNSAMPTAAAYVEDVLAPTLEEVVLGEALINTWQTPSNRWEAAQLRTLADLEADIQEGLSALEANPGWGDARDWITTSRSRKRDVLKTVYFERSL